MIGMMGVVCPTLSVMDKYVGSYIVVINFII